MFRAEGVSEVRVQVKSASSQTEGFQVKASGSKLLSFHHERELLLPTDYP